MVSEVIQYDTIRYNTIRYNTMQCNDTSDDSIALARWDGEGEVVQYRLSWQILKTDAVKLYAGVAP